MSFSGSAQPLLNSVNWNLFAAVSLMCLSASNIFGQTGEPARVAALRYALANGLVVQRDSVAVAWSHPREQMALADMGIAKQEARRLAQTLGPRAIDTAQGAVLQCLPPANGVFTCATSSRYAVVVVARVDTLSGGRAGGGHAVGIEVYSPGFRANERTRQMIWVRVSGRDQSWFAQGFLGRPGRIEPARVKPMLNPPAWPGGVDAATDTEQQVMELAAVTHLATQTPVRYSFAGFGIDPRLYTAQWNKKATREGSFYSTLSTSHTADHIAQLGDVLGTRSVIDDSASCAVVRPSVCRMGDLPGLVQFTQALVRDSTAQLSIFWMARELPAGVVATNGMVGWRFTLRRSNRRWTVAEAQLNTGG